jgi:uncharacterized protein YukE
MITGVETLALLKGIAIGLKEIQKNQKKMDGKLDQIQSGISRTEKKIDEIILRNLRAANQSLKEATTSENQNTRNDLLKDARTKFNELIVLDANESTSGTSTGKIDNKDLICLAYLGKFSCYVLESEITNAAIQVYECVQKCVSWDNALTEPNTSPLKISWDNTLTGLNTFPSAFFSKDYEQLLYRYKDDLLCTYQKIDQCQKFNFGQSASYNTKRGAKAIGALGVFAIAGAAAVVLPAGRATVSRAIITQGKRLWDVGIDSPFLEDIEQLKNEALNLESRLASLPTDLSGECKQKLQVIQGLKPTALLQKGWEELIPSLIYQLEKFIQETEGQLPANKKKEVKSQIAKLENGLHRGDVNSLKQIIKEASEIMNTLSGLAKNWKELYSNLEECGLLD